MPLPAIIANLTARVQAVTPSWDADLGFHTLEGDGVGAELETVPDDVTRLFDLDIESPEDDGASGYVTDRFRITLNLRVRYPAHDKRRAKLIIASDAVRLNQALIHPNYTPAWIDGIEAIQPLGKAVITEITSGEGRVIALIASWPVVVRYIDAGEAGDA